MTREERQKANRTEIDKIIREYVEIYELANGRMPTMTYRNGWFTLHTGSASELKYRKSEILKLTGNLAHRVASRRNSPND